MADGHGGSEEIVIILVAGWSQAGKDTSADFLVNHYKFTKIAFAEAIKIAAAAKYNFNVGLAFTQEGKNTLVDTEKGLRTVRDLLIEYGNSERMKNIYVFAEVVANQIKDAVKAGQTRFVISDWRLLDELIGLQRYLSIVSSKIAYLPIRIWRRDQTVSPVPDQTEYALIGFPYWANIQNPVDDRLFANIRLIFREIFYILNIHEQPL